MKWRLLVGSLALVALLGLTDCGGEKTFPAVPDCSGTLLVAYTRMISADTADVYLFDLQQFGYHALPGLNSTTQADLHPSVTRDFRFVAFERVVSPLNHDVLVYDRCQAALLPRSRGSARAPRSSTRPSAPTARTSPSSATRSGGTRSASTTAHGSSSCRFRAARARAPTWTRTPTPTWMEAGSCSARIVPAATTSWCTTRPGTA
jgi:hypothetical protein